MRNPEIPEPLIVSQPGTSVETAEPALVKDEKLSDEGKEKAAARLGVPPDWQAIANAIAKKNGFPENPVERELQHLEQRAVEEGLEPGASKSEIFDARMNRLGGQKQGLPGPDDLDIPRAA